MFGALENFIREEVHFTNNVSTIVVGIEIMNQTFTLPQNLAADIERLKGVLGLDNLETTIEYLLKTAVSRERVLGVVRSYQNQQKTLRQCAEALNVELDEVIEILQEHGVVFHHDDLPQQLEVVNRLAQQMKAAQA